MVLRVALPSSRIRPHVGGTLYRPAGEDGREDHGATMSDDAGRALGFVETLWKAAPDTLRGSKLVSGRLRAREPAEPRVTG
jgi:hypothetical protein